MSLELNETYQVASIKAKWLTGIFKKGTDLRRLNDFLVKNQVGPIYHEVGKIVARCLKHFSYSEEVLLRRLEEVNNVYEFCCNGEIKGFNPIVLNIPGGLVLPKTITHFYWKDIEKPRLMCFLEALTFQIGDIINMKMLGESVDENVYYVESKRTEFRFDSMVIGYFLEVWNPEKE